MRISEDLNENLDKVRKRWTQSQLPEDMSDLSFLDVGWWGGGFVKIAEEKGAKNTLGIDFVKSENMHDIKFIQCDIFSEKYLELPKFDIVFCWRCFISHRKSNIIII